MKRNLMLAALTITGLLFLSPAHAEAQPQERKPIKIKLAPLPFLSGCLPRASATVTIFPKAEGQGVDTLDLKAQGLPPNTSFAAFLTELPTLPIGAVQHIADFTTNEAGNGSVRVNTMVTEAFALDAVTSIRKDLNWIVIWFADPAGDDVCFGPGGGPVSPFDGDGEAGIVALVSQSAIP